jgi:hypothetical protein
MTNFELAYLMDVAEKDLTTEQDAHPEIAYAVAGSACLLRVGLDKAEAITAPAVQRQHLITIAGMAAANLGAALDRHPHLLERAKLLADCVSSLASMATAARSEAA